MTALFRKFIFLSFPLSLLSLGVATRSVSESAVDPSDTRGLPAVIIYFVALLVFAAISFVLAVAGRLMWKSIAAPGVAKLIARLVCFLPAFIASGVVAILSIAFVLGAPSGWSALILACFSMVGCFSAFCSRTSN